jgi:hypothetical protein
MARVPRPPRPTPQRPSLETIQAVFLGYHAAGKSTFLTAIMLASYLGRLRSSATGQALVVKEVLESEQQSFFRRSLGDTHYSRIDLLRKGENVPKTPVGEWYIIDLELEFAGMRAFGCRTIDYPGELAAITERKGHQERLQDYIGGSDCLYLFFDASLGRVQDVNDVDDRIMGQGDAIQTAYREFTEQRPGWPIVIVVTKADLLFPGLSSQQVSAEIERLNAGGHESTAAAEERLRRFLREQKADALAEVLLHNRHRASVRVCYVAALGARPREVPGPNGEHLYAIAGLADWVPLGVTEALETGMFAAIQRRRRQVARRILHGLVPYAVGLMLLVVVLAAGLYRDQLAVDKLEQRVADYDEASGRVSAETVLEQARRTHSWRHPFLALADQPTPFGNLPRSEDAVVVRAIERRFTLLTLDQRLQTLRDGNAQLREFLALQDGFAAMTDELAERHGQWLALAEDLERTRRVFELLPDGASAVVERSRTAGEAQGQFLLEAVQALWQLASDTGIEAAATQQKVLPYLETLRQLRAGGLLMDSSLLDQAIAADHRGRCDLLFSRYQRVAMDTPDQRDARFSSLAEACLSCGTDSLRQAFCANLARDADHWDYYEAKLLYPAYQALNGPEDVTAELVQNMQTYLDHAEQRRRLVPDHTPFYRDQAHRFLDWHAGLTREYRLDGVHVRIPQDPPFVKINSVPYEYQDGYSTRTGYRREAVTPRGILSLLIDGAEVASTSYETFSPSLPAERFRWGPGQSVELRISNNTNGATTRLGDFSDYALLRAAKTGLSNSDANARFSGLDVPALEPSELLPPVPPTGD